MAMHSCVRHQNEGTTFSCKSVHSIAMKRVVRAVVMVWYMRCRLRLRRFFFCVLHQQFSGMETPMISYGSARSVEKSFSTKLGVVVISLQCVWLLSLQMEVAHLKQAVAGSALLGRRARVEAHTQEQTRGSEHAAGFSKTAHDASDALSEAVTNVQDSTSSLGYLMMAPNLISNSFMNNLNGARPQGFDHFCMLRRSPWTVERDMSANCMMTISAVHPFTKCFEGPYCDNCAAEYPNAATTCDEATEERPFIFGTWNMGPRSGRGGLSDGWNGYPDGKILKIQGYKVADWQAVVALPHARRVQTDQVLFRGFLKILSGKASIQTDIGCDPDPELTAITSAAATTTNGWLAIHKLVSGSRVTHLGLVVFNLNVYGDDDDQTGTFEMYLALPYMANVVEKLGAGGQQSVAWVG